MPKKRQTFNYPPCIDQESGCKVGWRYYATETDARKAAKVAVQEGKHMAELGYDFGYRMPGECDPITEGARAGQWVVVVP